MMNPRIAHLRIRSTSERLDRIVPRLAVGVGNVLAGQRPDIDERQRPEDVPGVRRKGWAVDPTGEGAIGRVAAIGDVLDDLDAHLAAVTLAVGLIESFVDRWAPILTEVRLCGDHSPTDVRRHPRFRPDCREMAEANPDGRGYRSTGVCAACRKRIERHDREIETHQ